MGEFLGYSLRSVSGYVSDKTERYWLITFVGYSVNLLAVPAMALAGSWPVAAGLVLAERVGLFYLGYGAGWLVGGVTAGLLYERSIPLLIAFSVAVQLASIPVFFVAQRTNR